MKSAPGLQNEISRAKEGILQYKPWKKIYPECSLELLSAVAVWLRYIADVHIRNVRYYSESGSFLHIAHKSILLVRNIFCLEHKKVICYKCLGTLFI